jgi:acyl dehydratase
MPADAPKPVEELVTQEKINRYADLSGDYNPLHVDPEVAAASEFGGTIAHGPISLQSGLRALTDYVGEEALPAGTTIAVTYRYPVRPGDTVRFDAEAVRAGEDGGSEIDGQCVNQDGKAVASLSIKLP